MASARQPDHRQRHPAALSHRPHHTPPIVFRRLVLVLFLVAAAPALAAPDAELWVRWTAHDPESSVTVDHRAWDRLLATYAAPGADGVNRSSPTAG